MVCRAVTPINGFTSGTVPFFHPERLVECCWSRCGCKVPWLGWWESSICSMPPMERERKLCARWCLHNLDHGWKLPDMWQLHVWADQRHMDLEVRDSRKLKSLPSNYQVRAYSCQQLNAEICGPLFREGLLCSKCISGYGIPLYSNIEQCVKCHHDNSAWLWLIYIALELAPPTIFYWLVIIFNVSTTSPPYTAIVFFSQLFGVVYKINAYIRLTLKIHTNRIFLSSVLTLINIWNLDIFQHIIPPFCVSSKLTNLHAMLFEYISALYPLVLIFVTYAAIELHARNCRPLVILWKPFHGWFAKCRRNLDPKSSVITGFATFISLSVSKVMFTTFLILFPGSYKGNSTRFTYKSLYDPQVEGNSSSEYLRSMASTYYTIPLLVVILLVHIPILLLLLYPIKIFRRLLSYCGRSKYRTILVLVDTFQGHYKDGTTGTFDYRAASSISFLFRLALCELCFSHTQRMGIPIHTSLLPLIMLLLFTSLFYGVVQPCKKKYMNVSECVLYLTAALVLLQLVSGHDYKTHNYQLYIILAVMVVPSLLVLFSLVAKVTRCLPIGHLWWKRLVNGCKIKKLCEKWDDGSEAALVDSAVPDRLQNPLDYIPLPWANSFSIIWWLWFHSLDSLIRWSLLDS